MARPKKIVRKSSKTNIREIREEIDSDMIYPLTSEEREKIEAAIESTFQLMKQAPKVIKIYQTILKKDNELKKKITQKPKKKGKK